MPDFKNLSREQKYFALAFLIGFLVKYNYLLTQIFRGPSWLGGILRNIFFVVFIAYFLFPLTRTRSGRKKLLIFSGIFTFVFTANLWYNRYFGNYLGFTDIIVGESIGSPLVIFRHIMNFWDPLFLIDLIIMGFLLSPEEKTAADSRTAKSSLRPSSARKTRKVKLLVGLVLILLLTTQVLATNMQLGSERPVDLYRRSTGAFVSVYGILPLYLYEAYYTTFYNDLQDRTAELPEMLKSEELDGENVIPRDSNIIVIQVESLDEKLLGYEHNGRELTPFLNNLKDNSLYGSSFYTKHVNGSFDADFSLLTSLYPINRTYAFKQNDMTEFASLPNIFREEGYQTLAFHGNKGEFFYRHQAYPDLGFDRFYSRENYSAEDRVMDMEEGYLGINDYDFFKQSLDFLENHDEPFLGLFITVTSHTPFNFYPEEMMVEEYADIENPLVHDFFQSISFVDKSLEMFFSELEERGLKDNTLFVIYSDHDASIDTPEYSSSLEFELKRNVKKPEHIPLLIYHPELEPGKIEVTGTITDLAPTILDLLGKESLPDEFLGRSLLEGEEKSVHFLHEFPQIFYRNQLFLKELDEIHRVGHVRNQEDPTVELTEQQKDETRNIITFIREKMETTLRD